MRNTLLLLFMASLLISCTLTNMTNLVSSDSPRACPNAGGMPPLALSDDPTTFAPAIKTFLSDGGSVAFLEERLSEAGFLQAVQLEQDLPDGGGIWYEDITGDGYEDVLVNLSFVASDEFNNPYQQSIIWLFACDNGFYQIASENLSDTSARYGVQVGAVADLNGDSRSEIYYHLYDCVVEGCMVKLNVWMWNGNRLVPMLDQDLVFKAGTYRLEDNQLFIFTAVYAPIGITITERPTRQVWEWFGNRLVLKHEQPEVVTTTAEAIMDMTQAWSVGAFNDAEDSLAYARTMQEENPFWAYAEAIMTLAQSEAIVPSALTALMALADTEVTIHWKHYGQLLLQSTNRTQGCLAVLNALEADLQQGRITLHQLLGVAQTDPLPSLNDLCPF